MTWILTLLASDPLLDSWTPLNLVHTLCLTVVKAEAQGI